MITSDDPSSLNYGIDDTTRHVLSGILRKIGAPVAATIAANADPSILLAPHNYIPGIDALECLRDLKSVIDRSEAPFAVLCVLMQWRCVELHLAPLLLALSPSRQREACMLVLRVLNMMLKGPGGDGEEWGTERLHFQRMLKRCLGTGRFLGHLLRIMAGLLSDGGRLTSVDDEEMMKAVMFCLKSILAVPDAAGGSGNLCYGRSEEVLEAMVQVRLFEFLLCLVSQVEQFNDFVFKDVIEIFATIFGNIRPGDLLERTDEGNDADLLCQEHGLDKRPVRHGRFAGSVVVQLSTGKELLLKASSQFASGIDYDLGKKNASRKRQLNYHIASKHNFVSEHHRALFIQCSDDFLNSAFNILAAKGQAVLEKGISDHHVDRIATRLVRMVIFALEYCLTMNRSYRLIASVSVSFAFILHRYFSQWLIEKEYANETVLDHYVTLMDKAPENDPAVNLCIAKFFNWMHDQLKAHDLLHRVHLMNSCHSVICQDQIFKKKNDEIVVMAKHIARSFLKRLRSDPALAVMALLSVSARGLKVKTMLARSDVRHAGEEAEKTAPIELSGDRIADISGVTAYAVQVEELSATLNWLLEVLNFRLNEMLSDGSSSKDREDAFVVADRKSRREALERPVVKQLLLLVGLKMQQGRWAIPGAIDVTQLEADIQAIMRSKTAAEQGSAGSPNGSANTAIGEKGVDGSIENYDDDGDESDEEEKTHGIELFSAESQPAGLTEVRERWEQTKKSHHFLTTTGVPLVIDSD